jgi:uncharacterized membrane protein YbhN (UPF0104 family)
MVTLQYQIMQYSISYKTKQFFFVLAKLGLISALAGFIYYKLTSNTSLSFSAFSKTILKNNVFSVKNLFVLSALSTCNWVLEILKWKYFVKPIKTITFKTAALQSLSALAISLLTPNRVGEYGVKALYFESRYRRKIMLITFLSNVLQLFVTLVIGSIGLYFFTTNYSFKLVFSREKLLLFLSVLLVLICIVLVLFKAFKGVSSFFKRTYYALSVFKRKQLVFGFLLSLSRYVVFSFQFYYLLTVFKLPLSYLEGMSIIASVYLIASFIPAISVLDVVVKGGVAVYLFSFVNADAFVVLSITSLMWLLNFMLPACIGCAHLVSIKSSKLL